MDLGKKLFDIFCGEMFLSRRLFFGAITQQRYDGGLKRLSKSRGSTPRTSIPVDDTLLPIEAPPWMNVAISTLTQIQTSLHPNNVTASSVENYGTEDVTKTLYRSIISYCESGCHALALSLYNTAPRSILSQSTILSLSERQDLYTSLLSSASSLLDPRSFEELLQSAYQDRNCGKIFDEEMQDYLSDVLTLLYIECGKDEQSVLQHLINVNLARIRATNETYTSPFSLMMQIKAVSIALSKKEVDIGTKRLLNLAHLLRHRVQELDEIKDEVVNESRMKRMSIINSILKSFPIKNQATSLDIHVNLSEVMQESKELCKKMFILCLSQGHGGAATAAYYAHRSILQTDKEYNEASKGDESLDFTSCLQGAVSVASPALAEAVILDLYTRRSEIANFNTRLVEALNFLVRAYAASGDATGSLRTLCLIPPVMGTSPDIASSKAAAHCLQKLALQMFYWERTFRKQQEVETENDQLDPTAAVVALKGRSNESPTSSINNDVDDEEGRGERITGFVKADESSSSSTSSVNTINNHGGSSISSGNASGGDVEYSMRPNRPEALQALATGYSVGSFLVRVACLASAEAHLLGSSQSLHRDNSNGQSDESADQADGWRNLLESAISNAEQQLLNNNEIDLSTISTSLSVSTLLNKEHGGAAQSLPAGNWRMFDTAKQTLGLPLQGRLSDVSDAAVLFPPALSALLWGMALSRARGNGPIFADYAMRSLGCEPTSEVFAALIAGHARDHREMNASSFASATDTLWRMANAKVQYTSSIYSELILLWLRAKLVDRAFFTLKLALESGLTVESKLFRACIRACSVQQTTFEGEDETAAAFAEFIEAADAIVGQVGRHGSVKPENIKQLQREFEKM